MDPRISYRMAAGLAAGLVLFVAAAAGFGELNKRSRQAETRNYIISELPEGFENESTFSKTGLETLFGEHPCGIGHDRNLRYLVHAGISAGLGEDGVTLERAEEIYKQRCDSWTSETRDTLNSVGSNVLVEQAKLPSRDWTTQTTELFEVYQQLSVKDKTEATALSTYVGFAALDERKRDELAIQTSINDYSSWKNNKHRVRPLLEALQRTGAITNDETYVGLMQSLQSSMKGLETCRGDHPQGARAQACGRELDTKMERYVTILNDMRIDAGKNTFKYSTLSLGRTRSEFTQATLTTETLYQ